MGLPQEVVEHIMDMLQGNGKALKACSLTCKAMFASTRHLIHQRLRVVEGTNQKIFTPAKKERYLQGEGNNLEFRFLSFMGERDLLKYARHLTICMGSTFRPHFLEPHLQHFRSLDRIHTLTIYSYDAVLWRDVHDTYFTQFYHTLTTLALHFPRGHYRYVLQFALQFPNLENLALTNLWVETWIPSGIPVPPMVNQSPPLRGRLRCSGLDQMNPVWPREFAFSLPNGINFRSVEFRYVDGRQGQQILDGCANSLEEFAITITGIGKESLPRFFVQPKEEVLIDISREFRTGSAPFPAKRVTPIHCTPNPIHQLAWTVDGAPLDKPFDHHVSRSHRVRARAGRTAVRVYPTVPKTLGKLGRNRWAV